MSETVFTLPETMPSLTPEQLEVFEGIGCAELANAALDPLAEHRRRLKERLQEERTIRYHAVLLYELLTGTPRHLVDSAPVQAALRALGAALGVERG